MQSIEDDIEDDIEDAKQAMINLIRDGSIVDSGRRRWSEQIQDYAIVWVAREFAKHVPTPEQRQESERLLRREWALA